MGYSIDGLGAQIIDLPLASDANEFAIQQAQLIQEIDEALKVAKTLEDIEALTGMRDIVETWNFLPPPDGDSEFEFDFNALEKTLTSMSDASMADIYGLLMALIDLFKKIRAASKQQELAEMGDKEVIIKARYEEQISAANAQQDASTTSAVGQLTGSVLQVSIGGASAGGLVKTGHTTWRASAITKSAHTDKVTLVGMKENAADLNEKIGGMRKELRQTSSKTEQDQIRKDKDDLQQQHKGLQKESSTLELRVADQERKSKTLEQNASIGTQAAQTGGVLGNSIGQMGAGGASITAASDTLEHDVKTAEADMLAGQGELNDQVCKIWGDAAGDAGSSIHSTLDIVQGLNSSTIDTNKNLARNAA